MMPDNQTGERPRFVADFGAGCGCLMISLAVVVLSIAFTVDWNAVFGVKK